MPADGRQEGRQDAQRGGLARAVRADEAEQVAFVDGEVQPIQGGDVAVEARQAEGLNGGDGWGVHNQTLDFRLGTGTATRHSVFFWLRRGVNWRRGFTGE